MEYAIIIAVAVILVILLFFVGIRVIAKVFYRKLMSCRIETSASGSVPHALAGHLQNKERVFFNSGKNRLTGYFISAGEQGNHRAIVILVHGYGHTYIDYLLDIDALIKHGYIVFAYDGTACGESEGDKPRGFAQYVVDAEAALTFVESVERYKSYPIVFYGHSLGAYGAAAASGKTHDRLVSLVAISGMDVPGDMARASARGPAELYLKYVGKHIEKIEAKIFGDTVFLSAVEGINAFKKRTLIISGGKDTVVTPKLSLFNHKTSITNPYVQYYVSKEGDHYTMYNNEKTAMDPAVLSIILEFINKSTI